MVERKSFVDALDAKDEAFRTSISIKKTLWKEANRMIKIDEEIPEKNFSEYIENLVEADLKKRGKLKK